MWEWTRRQKEELEEEVQVQADMLEGEIEVKVAMGKWR